MMTGERLFLALASAGLCGVLLLATPFTDVTSSAGSSRRPGERALPALLRQLG